MPALSRNATNNRAPRLPMVYPNWDSGPRVGKQINDRREEETCLAQVESMLEHFLVERRSVVYERAALYRTWLESSDQVWMENPQRRSQQWLCSPDRKHVGTVSNIISLQKSRRFPRRSVEFVPAPPFFTLARTTTVFVPGPPYPFFTALVVFYCLPVQHQ